MSDVLSITQDNTSSQGSVLMDISTPEFPRGGIEVHPHYPVTQGPDGHWYRFTPGQRYLAQRVYSRAGMGAPEDAYATPVSATVPPHHTVPVLPAHVVPPLSPTQASARFPPVTPPQAPVSAHQSPVGHQEHPNSLPLGTASLGNNNPFIDYSVFPPRPHFSYVPQPIPVSTSLPEFASRFMPPSQSFIHSVPNLYAYSHPSYPSAPPFYFSPHSAPVHSFPPTLPHVQPSSYPSVPTFGAPDGHSHGLSMSQPVLLPQVSPPAPTPVAVASVKDDKSSVTLSGLLAFIKELKPLDNNVSWARWQSSVREALMAGDLLCHILLDEPSGSTPRTSLTVPSYRPQDSSAKQWDARDRLARTVITYRLSDSAKALLPPSVNELGQRSTARDAWSALKEHFDVTHDSQGLQALEYSLITTRVHDGDIDGWVSKWKSVINVLHGSGQSVGWKNVLSTFAHLIPNHIVYAFICNDILQFIEKHARGLDDVTGYKAWNDFSSQVLRAHRNDTIGNKLRGGGNRGNGGGSGGGNGGGPGGGGKGNERRRNGDSGRNDGGGGPPKPSGSSPPKSTNVAHAATTSPDKDTSTIINMPVDTSITSNIISSDVYALRDPLNCLIASTDVSQAIALASVHPSTILLDSACTTHLIRNRSDFITYDETTTRSVTTADSSSMITSGSGDCMLRINLAKSDKVLHLRLHNCLHAPNAPANLISQGALVENGFTLHIGGGDYTMIFIPHSNRGNGSREFFTAPQINRLTYIHGVFINTEDKSSAVLPQHLSCPSFDRRPYTGDYIHEILGHSGWDRVVKVIRGNFGTGLPKWNKETMKRFCPPCIKGKQPHPSHGQTVERPTEPLQLVFMDTCGPMLVKTPKGELHFHLIGDSATAILSVSNIRKRPQAFNHLERTLNLWENKLGVKTQALRMDGAKEFHSEKIEEFLRKRGIQDASTAPYAHWQNGRAERWIRLVEDMAMVLLQASGLPLSFWGDAVHTAVFIIMRLPTTALSHIKDDVTPYELLNKSKPDYSILRVFGCQCFFWVPNERRTKFGDKYEEGIFVGYVDSGYRVRGLNGTYHEVPHDCVVFNEWVMGKLSAPKSRRALDWDPSTQPPVTDVERDLADRERYLSKLRSRSKTGTPSTSSHSAITDFVAYTYAESLLEGEDPLLGECDLLSFVQEQLIDPYFLPMLQPNDHPLDITSRILLAHIRRCYEDQTPMVGFSPKGRN
ncbi:hypothetical protein D9757_013060 [Collybiopsis confluens]|uniref:Integrase catalytic domain-containing protein n=1 Tax=Collybiopsis confluens TaxID=2823264 RepID=A0A8H5G3B9_9AGAR|nr:hypothetical protein D9757_013060 [Collybiopsis confluens]